MLTGGFIHVLLLAVFDTNIYIYRTTLAKLSLYNMIGIASHLPNFTHAETQMYRLRFPPAPWLQSGVLLPPLGNQPYQTLHSLNWLLKQTGQLIHSYRVAVGTES